MNRKVVVHNDSVRQAWHEVALCLRLSFFMFGSLISLTNSVMADEIDYQRDIRPIFAEHCISCHGPDAGQRQAGLRLDLAEPAKQRLDSGDVAIVPFKSADSELVRRILSEDENVVMPPSASRKRLTPADKDRLTKWIDAGATYSEHWSFRKPTRPAIPHASNETWSRNPVDQFVLARLDRERLSPAHPTSREQYHYSKPDVIANLADPRPGQEANREVLIRRLFLDLIGMPPSIVEADDFLADTSIDAFERVVDRLLASPHYGEKVAQDWLDLARFGDTSGYQDDNDRPNWPYRDVVINAINANQPYDQFTIENLAGDLLPNPTIPQRVLSGFNRLHRYNEEGGSDPDEFRVVYALDRTNTTAATWMGLSFGCAQCHDHKYDPLSQREYYQFYAFFNSLEGEIPISKGPANPPQIPVPGAIDHEKRIAIDTELTQLRTKQQTLEGGLDEAFQQWLNANHKSAAPASTKGAVGGTVARTDSKAWYADTQLEETLTLATAVHGHGRVMVARSINNDVEFGYFSRDAGKGLPGIGWSVAEGPRFFVHFAAPDGSVVHSGPFHAEHGVEYEWQLDYDPTASRISLELRRGEARVCQLTHVLTESQRQAELKLDSFGFNYRGTSNHDTPIEFYVDDIKYTVSSNGGTRSQIFDCDPRWNGSGNQSSGHQFGYDPVADTVSYRGRDSVTTAELLAVPTEKQTDDFLERLKRRYVQEFQPELWKTRSRVSQLQAARSNIDQTAPLALVWIEMPEPRPAFILTRGDYLQPAQRVDRNVPEIFPRLKGEGLPDRLALARWLVSGEHPLTARVTVNRFWKQVFGKGLVRTPEDFGVRGDLPTHPELLDWLAVEFTSNGWDAKRLLRQIVCSATFRQSSAATPMEYERDPDNRLLARGARFRLTAEEIRDCALKSAGLLTQRIGGRSVFPYQPDHFYRDKEDDPNEWKWPVETDGQLYRRGLYTFVRRTSPYPASQAFDSTSRGECTIARARTNTPLQALVTLNDPVFIEAARVLAERTVVYAGKTSEDRIEFLFRTVLTRSPAERERQILLRLYEAEIARYGRDPTAAVRVSSIGHMPPAQDLDPGETAAWTAVANALLNLDEAITRQ